MIKLSMITVCRNAESCIEKTMKSVLAQTEPVYEYIIIDGKSKDSTIAIIDSFRERFLAKNICFKYISEHDFGIGDAFNKGISLAEGELIGLINAADEMTPETSIILKNAFMETNADIIFGDCLWIDENNNLSYVMKPKESAGKMMYKLLYEMVLIHPATFIRKTAYEKYGMYDIQYKYCMDQELLYRMYVRGASFFYINKILAKMMAGGVSDLNPGKVFKEASQIALAAGEPVYKVRLIEKKKYLRNRLACVAKRMGVYRVLKRQIPE